MSSSSSSTEISTTLATTTTFLPILDDLLSPDFRPVTLPSVTPLQTPTTATSVKQESVLLGESSTLPGGGISCPGSEKKDGSSSSGGAAAVQAEVVISSEDAASKIQKWWKKTNKKEDEMNGEDDEEERTVVENVKHSIRHKRAEEHIRYLESELTRLKSSLLAERKLRSLQYEAIRSLWSQVQKLSVNNNPAAVELSQGIMSQSCPNGLPTIPEQANQNNIQNSAAAGGGSCDCATEIKDLKSKLETELSELRGLIVGLTNNSKQDGNVSGGEGDAGKVEKCNNNNKRPDTLDLNNSGSSDGGSGASGNRKAATGEELKSYADNMAKFVVERGISDNNIDEKGCGESV